MPHVVTQRISIVPACVRGRVVVTVFRPYPILPRTRSRDVRKSRVVRPRRNPVTGLCEIRSVRIRSSDVRTVRRPWIEVPDDRYSRHVPGSRPPLFMSTAFTVTTQTSTTRCPPVVAVHSCAINTRATYVFGNRFFFVRLAITARQTVSGRLVEFV